MKTFLKLAVAGVALLGLSSCDHESEDTRTFSVTLSAYNLITSVDDASAAPFVGLCAYNFSTKYPDQTVTLSSSVMALPDGGTASFTTVPMQMGAKIVQIEGKVAEQVSFSSADPTQTGAKITSLNAILTQAAYAPGDVNVPGYTRKYPGSMVAHFPIIDYTLNESWRIRTFWSDMTFVGSTTTTYPGMTGTYTNNAIRYRVVMKTDQANKLTGKADVIFYNAKFAASDKAPVITVVLQNLDLKFTDRGYTVSGADIEPFMVEGEQLQPTPAYTFDKFSLTAVGDLTQCSATYTVAKVFNGSFQGTSIAR